MWMKAERFTVSGLKGTFQFWSEENSKAHSIKIKRFKTEEVIIESLKFKETQD